jgi:RNA polymerase sigma-70 factor (TIGR02943 family)
MTNLAERIAAEHPVLMRTARQLLRNRAWAEDAVSETLVAALENPSAFRGGSSLRTWLVAILRHKAVDEVRRHTRECQGEPCVRSSGLDDWTSGTPIESAEAQAPWADPQERLSSRQFMTELDRCLKTLPSRQARAFIMRNVLEQETPQICDELGITANGLFVTLHRARRGLRRALQARRAPVSASVGLLQPQA